MSLWLIGAGTMSLEYAKVLNSLGIDYDVICRSSSSAEKFEKEINKHVISGGLSNALKNHKPPDQAIVAVGVEDLAKTAIDLINAGTKRILLEKPGGISTNELSDLYKVSNSNSTSVLLAYNRRFYASTQTLKEMIIKDGGATSCNFEFTEWSHVIRNLVTEKVVKESWFLANSTHVVDLAFYLCGYPSEWQSYYSGSLDWHPSASRFCGSGITEKGILFSYHADWEAPGRWSLEILTKLNRYILRPIERLQKIPIGKLEPENVNIDDEVDKKYKPGLYKQVKAFINYEDEEFCTIKDQVNHCSIYDKIAGYNK